MCFFTHAVTFLTHMCTSCDDFVILDRIIVRILETII